MGVGMVTRTALFDRGEPEELIMERMEQTSIKGLASIVGMTQSGLVYRLDKDGFSVDDPEMTVEQLAEQLGAETDDILLSVFR